MKGKKIISKSDGRQISALKMYDELAKWWPLISDQADYAQGAAFFRKVIFDNSKISPKTLLELGSGGGSNAAFLKGHFDLTLVDISPKMLEVSRTLNPDCEHLEGDMRTVRLGREFDAVFIEDAIMYMTSETDLKKAIYTAFIHCKPGGIALFCPDDVRETFHERSEAGGHDGKDRSIRYLEWHWDPDPADSTFIAAFAYIMRETGVQPKFEEDVHVLGLFPRSVWLRIISDAGFKVETISFCQNDGSQGCEVFLGLKP